MLNVHLNGDIVRCPDIAAIHARAQEVRDAHKICKYNVHEDTCEAWLSHYKSWMNIKNNQCSGRCPLSGSDACPGHQRRKKTGSTQKTFKIDNTIYRKISGAAHYMVKESKHKTLFFTLTFPKFKPEINKLLKNENNKIDFEKIINQAFSRFMDNLHNNYDVKNYVAVRERGEIRGRYHYHVLLSIKFVDFTILNSAWCSAISDICEASRNALQTDRKNVILRNAGYALRYCCKYFSKQRGARSNTRLIFISNNLLSHDEPDEIDAETGEIKTFKRVSNVKKSFSGSIQDILDGFKSIYIVQTSDYSTCFRITESKEFDRFCQSYIYKLFGLRGKTDFCGLPGYLNE